MIAERSAWNPSRTRIHTDLVILRDDGRLETRRVPGGEVDGLAMIQFHVGPAGTVVGWVPARSARSDAPLRWEASCVYITPDAPGTTDIPGDGELTILQEVLDHWEQATASCGYLTFRMDEPAAKEVGYDGVNVIKYRHDTWGRPASGDDPAETYDPQAAALTTLFYEPESGIIRDADIEMNAVNFAVGVCSAAGVCETEGQGSVSDLANTMTHEVGHLVGLDHTCWDMAGAAPVDGDGNVVPDCFPVGSLTPEIVDATMYNYQDPGEVKKATLEADDIDGFCAGYPKAEDPGFCERALDGDDGWCAVATPAPLRRAPVPPWLLLAAGLALAALARRR